MSWKRHAVLSDKSAICAAVPSGTTCTVGGFDLVADEAPRKVIVDDGRVSAKAIDLTSGWSVRYVVLKTYYTN
jgi:hypothetical protein